ncbi:unnamed protein product [Polarella glacialis]|uniref:N-acetyltransferase domain-containing protein n=1 Tax=Polarella glacialis TaxID=89957 RepID=A0A813GX12_POLGL|nr:unnamed protein product [Polarella glacialis]
MAGGYPASNGTLPGKDSKLSGLFRLLSRSLNPSCPAEGESAGGFSSSADVPSTNSGIAADSLVDGLSVVIGTSQMVAQDSTLVRRIAKFSDKYEGEVRSRLSYGDAGHEKANRVMHVAFFNGVAVGWCSSTPGWGCGRGGHWGALAVDPSAQGKGVGSALVKAAEQRLLDAGCNSVQIEYRFVVGDPAKERLYAWYEGKLDFDGGPRRSGFRCCHKALSTESFRAQHMKNHTSQGQLHAEPQASGLQHEAKRARASSQSSSSSESSESRSASQQLDQL